MKERKACFVCTTPYQIINAVVIVKHYMLHADLYIVPQFLNADGYCRRIKSTNIFNEVSVVNTDTIEAYKNRKNKVLFYGGIVWNYLNINNVARQILLPGSEYNYIFISSKANIGRLICLYYIHNHKKAKIYYFDDGEGSYDNIALFSADKYDAYIRKLLFGKRSIELSDTLFVLSPELFYSIHPNSRLKIKRIPSWSNDHELLKQINFICNYSAEKAIQKPVVLLDIICDEVLDKECVKKYKALRQKICELFGDSIIIKRHPRDNEAPCADVYSYNDIPFEVICANMNLEHSLFISLATSAVCMPKIIFNDEPAVVLLYHIIPPLNSQTVKRDEFYHIIKESYQKKELFCIPDNEEQLISFLKRLKESLVN